MHGFLIIREPRSGDERVRLKLFRFIQLWVLLSYPFPTVSTQFIIYTLYIKLKRMYPRFFRFLDFLHFRNNNSFMWLNWRLQKEKQLWRNVVFTASSIHVASLTLTLWFLRCSPSKAFKLFWQVIFSYFSSLASDFWCRTLIFNAGGLWECYTNWIKSRNTQRLRPNNLISLVSFVLLSSPKQSRRFTNFHQQIIGVIWLTEKFAFYYRCVSIDMPL